MSTVRDRLESALEDGDRFFMGQSSRHRAALDLARRLTELGVDYAIVGALALAAHGYERFTTDVDVLLTPEGLAKLKSAWLGRGYVESFPGSRGLRDTVNDVRIDVLLTGDFPGDGKPKPVAFPNPADVAVVAGELRVVGLERLLELKLSSGISAPHRLQDLADVIALVARAALPLDLADRLDTSVRDKYRELWHAAQHVEREE